MNHIQRIASLVTEDPDILNEVRLSRAEALSILGLPERFSDADLKSAYRTLIFKNHPDRGGDALKADRIISAYKNLSGDPEYQPRGEALRPSRPGGPRSPGEREDFRSWADRTYARERERRERAAPRGPKINKISGSGQIRIKPQRGQSYIGIWRSDFEKMVRSLKIDKDHKLEIFLKINPDDENIPIIIGDTMGFHKAHQRLSSMPDKSTELFDRLHQLEPNTVIYYRGTV